MKLRYSILPALLSLFYCVSYLNAAEMEEILPAKSAQWKQVGPGSFTMKDGVATTQGGMGLWWYSGKSFKNATFDIEVRLPNPKFNSGVFIRFPDPKGNPLVAVSQGYECQVSGIGTDVVDTGGIYGIQAPSHNTLKKAGEWNQYQITTVENYVLVVINGELVNVFQANKGRGEVEGHIGLQNHDPASKVSYRKITVREWGDNATVADVLKKLKITRIQWNTHLAKRKVNGQEKKWAEKMDIGPVWASTFADYYQRKYRVGTMKGLNLELAKETNIRALFDTESMRISSASQDGVKWGATAWTGQHHSKMTFNNKEFPTIETSTLAGWADAKGSFADYRVHKGHGNYSPDHLKYNGYFRHGTDVVLDYAILNSRVLEKISSQRKYGQSIVYRNLDLAPSASKRSMLVSDSIGAEIEISDNGKTAVVKGVKAIPETPRAMWQTAVAFVDHTTRGWETLSMGAPSSKDIADRNISKDIYFRVLPKFLNTHKDGGDEENVAVRLNDGLPGGDEKDDDSRFFFENAKKQGRLEVNLQRLRNINRIHIYSEQTKKRRGQIIDVYGTEEPFADPELAEKDLTKNKWKKVKTIKIDKNSREGKYGIAILAPKHPKKMLSMHKLLFIAKPLLDSDKHAFLTEIDIFEGKVPKLNPLASMYKTKTPSFVAHVQGNASFRDAGNGKLVLDVPASGLSNQVLVANTSTKNEDITEAVNIIKKLAPAPRELISLTKGGAALFPEVVITRGKIDKNKKSAWVTDQIGLPTNNPWLIKVRPGGFDFFSDGDSAALSTWEGDVWIVTGLKGDFKEFKWRRYASGLFETLGLKIVDDVIYVHGRDQLTRLHDQNNDGEADWYECFNNDVIITANFHEFCYSLQTDKEGNFYFTKGSPVRPGGRGFEKILPHNGTVMKVSKDGKKLEVIATGLRAPGGMAIGPNGEITTGENEGTWQPACKLNYFTGKDKFLGTEPAAHGLKGKKMHLPLVYFPHSTDNSGGAQVWIPSNYKKENWGLKSDELIHLSYGKSSLYRVLPQTVNGQIQGGVVRIPINIKSSAMRARFHKDHSLYSLGFRGWQTNAITAQAFARTRYTGKRVNIPDQMRATDKGIYLRFEHSLAPEYANDRFNYTIDRWKYIRCSQYGSGKFSIDNPDLLAEKLALKKESKNYDKRDRVEIRSAKLLDDGRTVFLYIPTMVAAEQLRIKYALKFTDGQKVKSQIMSTIHNLAPHSDKSLLEEQSVASKNLKNLKPGLAQTLTQGASQDTRISRFAAQFVAKGDNVSDMLDANVKGKKFNSHWSGYIVVDERMSTQFALEGNGSAMLTINDRVVLSRTGKFGTKVSEAIKLDPGAHKFILFYTSEENGTGQIRTLWKTKNMPLQPIAPKYYKYLPNEKILKAVHTRGGRDIMKQQNCAACHTDSEATTALKKSGVNLSNIGSKVNRKWLAEWLIAPHVMKPSTTHPSFLNTSSRRGKKEASDMVAYLSSLKGNFKNGVKKNESASSDIIKHDLKLVKEGGHMFNQLGCVACHTLPSKLYDSATERVALNNIHKKYPIDSLTNYLTDSKNAHPDFNFKSEEAKKLASFLHHGSKGKGNKAVVTQSRGDVVRGKKLIVKHNCSACHEGVAEGKPSLANLAAIFRKDWGRHGCGTGVKRRSQKGSPKLNLNDKQLAILELFRKHQNITKGNTHKFVNFSLHDFADRKQIQQNCMACHSKDGKLSDLSSLHQESAHLSKGMKVSDREKVDQSRPQLTYVGEMLHTDYIHKMLDGTAESPRPWLSMKMPAFHDKSDFLAKGISAQHGMAPSKLKVGKLDSSRVEIGKRLIGSNGGFACNMCHANGDTRAFAAFEVEGVNFSKVAERLRSGYYHSWMENPKRITPSTKMPRYTIGNKSSLPEHKGDAKEQFESILEYLKSIHKK